MTKGLKIWFYVCITGVLVGAAMLLGTAAQASDGGSTSKPDTTTSTTQKANGDTVTNTSQAATSPQDWLAPGGVLTVSIGGLFLIVREVKGIKQMDLQRYKDRADAAETKSDAETTKFSQQIERLEAKLDKALKDTEAKHDLYVAEITHRRRLELIMAEHGIQLPAE